MTLRIFTALALAATFIFAACSDDDEEIDITIGAPSPTVTETPGATPSPKPTTIDEMPPVSPGTVVSAISAATEALATWLGPVADPAAIEATSSEYLTWPDGCLGVKRAGQICTDALVPGFRIQLALGNAVYEVHTDETGDQTVWVPAVEVMVTYNECLTNLCTFTTDDGNTLEAQPVFGTDYGVDLESLSEGDPVAIALAGNPQDGPQLLVWVDPVRMP